MSGFREGFEVENVPKSGELEQVVKSSIYVAPKLPVKSHVIGVRI